MTTLSRDPMFTIALVLRGRDDRTSARATFRSPRTNVPSSAVEAPTSEWPSRSAYAADRFCTPTRPPWYRRFLSPAAFVSARGTRFLRSSHECLAAACPTANEAGTGLAQRRASQRLRSLACGISHMHVAVPRTNGLASAGPISHGDRRPRCRSGTAPSSDASQKRPLPGEPASGSADDLGPPMAVGDGRLPKVLSKPRVTRPCRPWVLRASGP